MGKPSRYGPEKEYAIMQTVSQSSHTPILKIYIVFVRFHSLIANTHFLFRLNLFELRITEMEAKIHDVKTEQDEIKNRLIALEYALYFI